MTANDPWIDRQVEQAAAEITKQAEHDAEMDDMRERTASVMASVPAGTKYLRPGEAPVYHAMNSMIHPDGTITRVPTGLIESDLRPPTPTFMKASDFKPCAYQNPVTGLRCATDVLANGDDYCGWHRALVAHMKATGITEFDIINKEIKK